MKIVPDNFIVPEGKRVKLKQWPTKVDSLYHSKKTL
jgi:hypothetical protein